MRGDPGEAGTRPRAACSLTRQAASIAAAACRSADWAASMLRAIAPASALSRLGGRDTCRSPPPGVLSRASASGVRLITSLMARTRRAAADA
jgi:hypothetical protein